MRTPPVVPWWTSLLLAVAGGAAGFFAFPHHSLWWLAPVSLLCLGLAVRGRSGRAGAGLGLVHGLAMLVPLLSWTGIQVGALPWLALATMESGFHAVGAVLMTWALRLRGTAPRVLGAATSWVAAEALQGRVPFGGFAWSKLAFTQADAPTLGLAALGGAPLVTFAVALTAAAAAEIVLALASRPVRVAIVPLAPLVAVLALATAAGAAVPRPTAAENGSLRVAGIQGSVPKMGLDFNAKRRAVLDKHAGLTEQLAQDVAAGTLDRPDLVVWPENASDIDPYTNPDARARITTAVDAVDAPTLLGTLVQNRTSTLYRNTVLLWEPGRGPVAAYAKRAPVPFAEYVPYRSFFRAITPLVDQAGRMEAGEEVGVLTVPTAGRDVRVGVLICFEVVPDRLVRDVVVGGAQLLVVPTNNATFGFTDESRQQLAISRLRAVETGRSVAHVSTVGVSGLIAPDGTVVQGSPLFSPTVLSATLPLRHSPTVATRLGALPELLLCLLAAGCAIAGRAGSGGRRTRRRQGSQGQVADEPSPVLEGTH